MARNKITQVTSKEIEDIINNSVQSAKNRLVGNAAEQKKMFVRPIANTDGSPNVAKLVQRLAKETESAVGQLEKEVDALETPPPPDSLPLMGVFLTYDEETETLDIIGEKGVDAEEVQDIVGNSTDAKFEEIGASLNQLTEQKQEKLTFADAYNPTTNKVATEQTVATEIAKIVGGADTSFDTLKEIADWINAHPESVTEINNKIKANASNISANQTAITNLQTLVKLLETNKQNATASDLLTTAKNIVGAINEVNKKVGDIPTWAKQPDKPQYSYNEIKNTPDFIENVDTANILYGTDENGNPALYPTDSVGTQVLVDGQKVKEFNADEKFDKTGGVIDGDVTVDGDLIVKGTTKTVDTETLSVKDNIIVANVDNTSLAGVSGFAVKTGEVDEETQKQLAYGIMYDKLGDGVKIGLGGFDENGDFVYKTGEAQFLATRADNITNGNLPKWDNDKKQFVDSGEKIGDYVKFTDYATSSKAGVVKAESWSAVTVDKNGYLTATWAKDTDIKNRYRHRVLHCNDIDNVTKEAIVSPQIEWADDDKTKACETIGAVTKTDFESNKGTKLYLHRIVCPGHGETLLIVNRYGSAYTSLEELGSVFDESLDGSTEHIAVVAYFMDSAKRRAILRAEYADGILEFAYVDGGNAITQWQIDGITEYEPEAL